MQKISCILLIIFCLSGCSVIKQSKLSDTAVDNEFLNSEIVNAVKGNNLTNNNLYISKAEIIISGEDVDKKLIASLKFNYPDRYLISVKSWSGIEVGRFFLTSDTILVNDRINKKLYYGSGQYFKRKYGIKISELPVIIGDLVEENLSDNEKTKCFDNKLNLKEFIKGTEINYFIDCKKKKIIKIRRENILAGEKMEFQYSDFIRNDKILFPGKIKIEIFQKKIDIEIKIKKVDFTWEGNIEFVPGKQYEKIHL